MTRKKNVNRKDNEKNFFEKKVKKNYYDIIKKIIKCNMKGVLLWIKSIKKKEWSYIRR